MKPSKQIVSVFGSVEDVSAKLSASKFSDVTVHSALELVLTGSVGLEINEDNTAVLAKDMCFLSVASDLTENSLSDLLNETSLTIAPLSVQVQDYLTEDSESDPSAEVVEEDDDATLFKGLAEDMATNRLNDNIARLQDTVARIREYTMMLPDHGGQINPHMSAVLSSDSTLGTMLPDGLSSGFLFCQLASIDHSIDGDASVVYDVEAPVLISGVIRRLTVDEEEGVLEVDPEGDELFVSDRSLSYIVESGTPSIITLITPRNEDLVEVRSWFVYLDSVDGMSPVVSEEIMKSVGAEINADDITVEHIWPADIALSPLHVSPSLFNQEGIVEIAESLLSEGPDDDTDD